MPSSPWESVVVNEVHARPGVGGAEASAALGQGSPALASTGCPTDVAHGHARQDELVKQTEQAGGALIFVPSEKDAPYLARFPGPHDHGRWLTQVCRVRSPELDQSGRWELARSSLRKVIVASLDEYGSAGLFRDVKGKLAECDARCENAKSPDCACGCLGENHGSGPGTVKWYEVIDAEVVWETETTRRMFRVFKPYPVGSGLRVYAGELERVPYTADTKRRERDGWPRAGEFLCTSCSARRATGWDHCHTHGYVRAPLCTGCNTGHWRGWEYNVRRSRMADPRYLRRCPYRPSGRCSP